MLNLDNTIVGLLLVGALGGGNPKKPPEKQKTEQTQVQDQQGRKASVPAIKSKEKFVKGE